jgi:hypothetical protein
MKEDKTLRVGDRVTLEGAEAVFLIVDLDQEKRTASLLPAVNGIGADLDKVSLDSLKLYQD